MDDRHSLSEPRPVDGCDLPTWEVDVFREGVSDPLLTLQINNHTLPPRYRKKKVIWKLPESADQTPSFGSDEKRRIWDLFKQQKKSRRKSLKKDVTGKSKDGDSKEMEAPPEPKAKVKSPPTPNGGTRPKVKEEITPMNDTNSANGSSNHGSEVSNGDDPPSLNDSLHSTENGTAPPPPPPPPGLFQETQQADYASLSNAAAAAAALMEPPHSAAPAVPLMEPLHTSPTHAAITEQQPSPLAPPGFIHSPPLPQPQRRSFCVSHDCPNIPVQLARLVIELYYKLVSSGNTELYLYFAPGIQKSLSVGGAHHVCVSRQEILLQIQSLANSQWNVRGVVAQEGIQNSVVLLITGSVICGAPQPEKMSYCHSLTLIPISSKGEYQIHNDALAFLSNKE